VTRPRAADDFDTIRARIEELRRERAQAVAKSQFRPAAGPRPYTVDQRPAAADKRRVLPPILRALARASTD